MLSAHALNLADSAASLHDRAHWTVFTRTILLRNLEGLHSRFEVIFLFFDVEIQLSAGASDIPQRPKFLITFVVIDIILF